MLLYCVIKIALSKSIINNKPGILYCRTKFIYYNFTAMILFSTVSTYKGITSQALHKLERHVRYNDIMETPAGGCLHDSFNKVYNPPLTISSIEQDDEEELVSQGKKPKTNKKSVQFHDVVQVHTSTQAPITLMEKHMTWYSVEELRRMKRNNLSYIKFLSSIGSEEINILLKNEVDDTETNDNSEVVCWRGLERFIPTSTCRNNEPLPVTLQLRRQNIVRNVLLKQSRIISKDEEVSIDQQTIDEIIRATSIEYSKSCCEYAYQIAQKSYCFARMTA
jgi:hypothetical protein